MKTREFTGFHMVLCLGGFFGVIAAVNLTLAYFANSTWTGLVVQNSFLASQGYNDVLSQARKQQAMGWKANLVYGDGRLEFKIADRNGNAMKGLVVVAKIGRPTNENEDFEISFLPVPRTGYSALSQLKDGQWEIDLVAKFPDGIRFRRIFRLQVGAGRG